MVSKLQGVTSFKQSYFIGDYYVRKFPETFKASVYNDYWYVFFHDFFNIRHSGSRE